MGARVGILPNLEADDLEIMWEAFQIAGWNGRWSVMDALLEAGLPVDHAPVGEPLVMHAIGNLRIPLLEYLVSRGADLDRVWLPRNSGSARSSARSRVLHTHDPRTAEVRRMLEICGVGTVEEILAEREAKRPSPPPLGQWATRVVHLARDDAGRLGQSAVTTENLLVGLLRLGEGAYAEHVLAAGADMVRLHGRLLCEMGTSYARAREALEITL